MLNKWLYTACIRYIMDYAAPVFHHALPQYLINELFRVEKRAMYIIFPKNDYKLALKTLRLIPCINCITYFHPDTKRSLKVGYSPYVNKAFVYISVFKILNFIRQLFIFSCFFSIINYQDTTIRLCKNIK